jgi:hypothetical protein
VVLGFLGHRLAFENEVIVNATVEPEQPVLSRVKGLPWVRAAIRGGWRMENCFLRMAHSAAAGSAMPSTAFSKGQGPSPRRLMMPLTSRSQEALMALAFRTSMAGSDMTLAWTARTPRSTYKNAVARPTTLSAAEKPDRSRPLSSQSTKGLTPRAVAV